MPLLSTFGAASARSFGGIGAAASSEILDIDDVFSTFLVTGTGSAYTANNGIDLSGEGGLVWIKGRSSNGYNHTLYDTERSGTLFSDATNAASDYASEIASYNSNGFTTVSSGAAYNNVNGQRYASWTWRKAPKFFTCLTYTGTGVNRTISHDLGSTPGMIIVKRTDTTSDWACYHRGLNNGTNPATKFIRLNLTNAQSGNAGYWNNTEPTDSVFTVGANAATNANGGTFVAYLFAHNNSDGEFGPDSDQDVIKCGTYTGGSSNTDQLGDLVNLGFEPQWIMVKNAETTPYGNFGWYMFDAMRGITTTTNDPGKDAYVLANSANDEDATNDYINLEANGFRPKGGHATNSHGKKYVYMAIRRGPLAEPTSATDVFAFSYRVGGPPNAVSGFPVDMGLYTNAASNDNKYISARLMQSKRLYTNQTYAQGSSSEAAFDYQNGFINRSDTSTDTIHWMWRRAPGYFDVVCHTGNGSNNHAIEHNLGVAPEMIWTKCRSSSKDWGTYVLGKQGFLNTTNSLENLGRGYSTTTAPTATHFYLNTTDTTNESGLNYISFLFASVDGVSKVGSFTSDGTDMTIDCGFSSTARFVLLKRTNSADDWFVFRDIVAGNDKRLKLNTTDTEATGSDNIDPDSSGFIINNNILGGSGNTFIFYAIA
tara:strand:+ start:763 stop:2724 length:1962 start_codon:yes stop_codon:yes gene_type:complete